MQGALGVRVNPRNPQPLSPWSVRGAAAAPARRPRRRACRAARSQARSRRRPRRGPPAMRPRGRVGRVAALCSRAFNVYRIHKWAGCILKGIDVSETAAATEPGAPPPTSRASAPRAAPVWPRKSAVIRPGPIDTRGGGSVPRVPPPVTKRASKCGLIHCGVQCVAALSEETKI